MYLLAMRIAFIAGGAGLALLAQADETVREINPNIANAQWERFEEMYPTSALCEVEEITLWTCEDDEATYSLCSSIEVTEDTGYIQYRVGTDSGTTFIFPEQKRHPKGVFTQHMIPSGDVTITFSHEGPAYMLVDRLRGPSAIQVRAESENDELAGVACHNDNQSLQLNYTLKLMYQAGIAD